MSKQDIERLIEQNETTLKTTQKYAAQGRGIQNDVVNLVVPMQLDQLEILRAIAAELPAD